MKIDDSTKQDLDALGILDEVREVCTLLEATSIRRLEVPYTGRVADAHLRLVVDSDYCRSLVRYWRDTEAWWELQSQPTTKVIPADSLAKLRASRKVNMRQ